MLSIMQSEKKELKIYYQGPFTKETLFIKDLWSKFYKDWQELPY